MNGTFFPLAVATLATVFVLSVPVHGVGWNESTALDEYVNRRNPYYKWEVLETDTYSDYTVTTLNLTSQKWMNESVTKYSMWWHYLSVFIPRNLVIRDAAYIDIGEDIYKDPSFVERMNRTAKFSTATGAVGAYLSRVPYLPIEFKGYEGSNMDFIWKVFIEDPNEIPNPDVVLLLPMTMAAKMALNAVTEFAASQDSSIMLTRFMPTGFSKNGWTTFLLGCVDRRIFAMAPSVFDYVNILPNLERHCRALGGWPWLFAQETKQEATRHLYHSRTETLFKFIDPLTYNERLTMPKLLITATGDEVFPLDDANFFYENITQPMFLQVLENDGHFITAHMNEINHNLQAFFLSAYRGLSFPQFSWTRHENASSGTIIVTTSTQPLNVSSWWADTTSITCESRRNGTCRRDFRKATARGDTGITWVRKEVVKTDTNKYRATFPKRTDFGYRAFFVELFFKGPDNFTFRFTTEVQVIPDTYPFPTCRFLNQSPATALSAVVVVVMTFSSFVAINTL